jgi:hypothetical protein
MCQREPVGFQGDAGVTGALSSPLAQGRARLAWPRRQFHYGFSPELGALLLCEVGAPDACMLAGGQAPLQDH